MSGFVKYGSSMPILIWIFFEVIIFIAIAKWLGIWVAIGLIIVPMIIGMILLRSAGMNNPQALQKMQMNMMRGGNPMAPMMKMMGMAMGGMLLIIPGFITTLIAILMLLPLTRFSVANWFMKRKSFSGVFTSKMQGNPFAGFDNTTLTGKDSQSGRTIDADDWKKD